MEALGEFYVSNTEATRRSLSAVVAKKNEESNKKVLETAEKFESVCCVLKFKS